MDDFAPDLSDQEIARLLDANVSGVIIGDAAGRINDVNDTFLGLHVYTGTNCSRTSTGKTLANAEIAAALAISPATVTEHVQNIMRKVGVQKRGQLFKRVLLD